MTTTARDGTDERGRPGGNGLLVRVDHILAGIEGALVVMSFAVMLIAMGWVIASRYFSGLGGGEYADLAVGLIPWVGMLGASLALRQGRHVGIAAVKQRLSAKGQRTLTTIADVMIVLFLVFLSWSGADLVLRQLESGSTTPAMELPRWLIALSVPVGAACAVVHQVVKIASRHGHDGRFEAEDSALESSRHIPEH